MTFYKTLLVIHCPNIINSVAFYFIYSALLFIRRVILMPVYHDNPISLASLLEKGQNGFFLITTLLLVFFLSYTLTSFADTQQQQLQPIKQSPDDTRQYDYIMLTNHLKVLLISDPNTDKSAVSLDVHRGSSSDPKTFAGLAHFLEHMLFLGTKKYPKAGEYQTFISAHGGNHNAYTSFEHTNYFFDIDPLYLEPAIDRFAQFFIAPLFTNKYVNREKNAVNSEYQARKKNDFRRTYEVWKQLSNPQHPFSQFSIGNLDTLADKPDQSTKEALIAFHKRYYSANIMTLVVLGKEPLSQLREYVNTKFSAIPNYNIQPLHITQPLFTPDFLPKKVYITPFQEQRSLSLSFPLPSLRSTYTIKPAFYISHLLGDESQGSLLSLLKSRGWAESLSAGNGMDQRDFSTFHISITLTEKGLTYTDEIARLVFQNIALIKNKGLQAWRYQEQQKINTINFRFKEKQKAINYVTTLSTNLQKYPPQDVIYGDYRMDHYDAQAIQDILARLTPKNVLISITAPNLPQDNYSPYFNTPYKVESISNHDIQTWSNNLTISTLQLPKKNPFIADNLELFPATDNNLVPQLIYDTPTIKLWHLQDRTFLQPRANIFINFKTPVINANAQQAALSSLYVEWIKDKLNEFSYPASLAGLSYSFYKHTRGFTLKVSGYNDKQSILIKKILAALRLTHPHPARFTRLKEQLLRSWKNEAKRTPYKQLYSKLSMLLLQPSWDTEALIAALTPLKEAALHTFVKNLSLSNIDILAHGNITKNKAKALITLIYPLPTLHQQPLTQVVNLTEGKIYQYDVPIEHNDSALITYLQAPDTQLKNRAKTALLATLIETPFYHALRTEKQLGYVVAAMHLPLLRSNGILFIVQSPYTAPALLSQHIESFLENYKDTLKTLSDADYHKYQQALLTQLREKPKNLLALTTQYWDELSLDYFQFTMQEQLITLTENLQKKDFIQYALDFLSFNKGARLQVKTEGKAPNPLFIIKNIHRFKERQRYFQSP